eukprot:2223135-Prymnesium_polylepis.1
MRIECLSIPLGRSQGGALAAARLRRLRRLEARHELGLFARRVLAERGKRVLEVGHLHLGRVGHEGRVAGRRRGCLVSISACR